MTREISTTPKIYGKYMIKYDKDLLGDICDIVDNSNIDIDIFYINGIWVPSYRAGFSEQKNAPKYTLGTRELAFKSTLMSTKRLDKWLKNELQRAELYRVMGEFGL